MIIVNFGEKHLDLLEEAFRRMKLLEDSSPNGIAISLGSFWFYLDATLINSRLSNFE